MINFRKTICCITQLLLLILSFLFIDCSSYYEVSVIGSVFVFLSIIINLFFNKKLLCPSNIILFTFCLFQFGLPFLKALDSDYFNWYISQMSDENLIISVKISTICIESFSLGLLLSSNTRNNRYLKSVILSDDNRDNIFLISRFLFIISALIAVPLAIYVVFLSFKFGYSYIKDDTMQIYNTFTRFAQQMIVPAMILFILFAKNSKSKRNMFLFAFFYAFILILTGARTVSLALFLVLLIMKNEENIESNKTSFLKKIVLFVSIFLILFIGVFVAQFRHSGTITSFSLIPIFQSIIEEMGFNFTSLTFTRLFVPDFTNFKYGLSYLFSIICLVPKSLDPTGIIDYMHSCLPETWLANCLSFRFGSLYDFGVGYSVIAEAYYNFGSYAFISILLQGYLIGRFLNSGSYVNSIFASKYVKYIMLFSLITYPRRTVITLLKSIEYCVVLVMILIYIISIRNKKYLKK